MSKFQLTLLITFGALIVGAVILFSLYRSSGAQVSHISVWGTLPSGNVNQMIKDAGVDTKMLVVTYSEIPENTFEQTYTEALATGRGPDLVIIPQSLVYKEHNKLIEIPYASVSQGDYQNTFIDEGDIFLDGSGAWALPFQVDPLVLYWNKTILATQGLVKPISYWNEIYATADKLTMKDASGNITRSTIALGETKNIPHAKDILTLLMLQAGSQILGSDQNGVHALLTSNENLPLNPAGAALDFYTEFSNSLKPYYSWNKSLLPAQSSFLVGDSAMYIGFASELPLMKAKSPTLPIGVSLVPQSSTSGSAITFGKLYGVAIARSTKNATGALAGALALISNASLSSYANVTGLPPVRRDLLSIKQVDGATQTFYTAAIQSKGFIDPDGAGTMKIFNEMIDSVTSGRARTTEAVSNANDSLQALINKTN
jgi:ABC-type glycerol-3-phosphate transport system substrate-binding protein